MRCLGSKSPAAQYSIMSGVTTHARTNVVQKTKYHSPSIALLAARWCVPTMSSGSSSVPAKPRYQQV